MVLRDSITSIGHFNDIVDYLLAEHSDSEPTICEITMPSVDFLLKHDVVSEMIEKGEMSNDPIFEHKAVLSFDISLKEVNQSDIVLMMEVYLGVHTRDISAQLEWERLERELLEALGVVGV